MADRITEEFEQKRNQQVSGIRAILDYLIGMVFMVIGIVCIVKFSSDYIMIAFGVVAILYGIWRVYKGRKKKSY
jgi:uncharacterized membrane protein HdeD (DUF308 family)